MLRLSGCTLSHRCQQKIHEAFSPRRLKQICFGSTFEGRITSKTRISHRPQVYAKPQHLLLSFRGYHCADTAFSMQFLSPQLHGLSRSIHALRFLSYSDTFGIRSHIGTRSRRRPNHDAVTECSPSKQHNGFEKVLIYTGANGQGRGTQAQDRFDDPPQLRGFQGTHLWSRCHSK